MCENLREKCEKVSVFGLRYVRIDMWEKFIDVCYDDCERYFNLKKNVKYNFINLSLYLKIFK